MTDNVGSALADHRKALSVHIRWMIRRDMPEVLQIEEASFDHPCVWTETDFLDCLRKRNCIGMVAEHYETIAGFMVYELHKSKLRLLDFAVDPKFRRRRVGTRLIQKLIGKLSTHRRNQITLEVRETNLEAQLFFRQQQFRAVGVLRGFYLAGGEDAYSMRFELPHSETLFESEEVTTS
jgi:[ribosomal protein S18]-alanine N-acetyltransferase